MNVTLRNREKTKLPALNILPGIRATISTLQNRFTLEFMYIL